MTSTDWRGRLDENTDDSPVDETLPRRREARELLAVLLRPHRTTVALLAAVVVLENVARLSVPILVRRGIDHGIPPITQTGSTRELLIIIAALLTVGLCWALFQARVSGQSVVEEVKR